MLNGLLGKGIAYFSPVFLSENGLLFVGNVPRT
jgi:hypothetical protein